MADTCRWTTSLHNLPKVGQDDVVRLVNELSTVKTSKLDKGYKFFYEQFIFNYRVSDLVNEEVVVSANCYRSMKKNEEPHSLQGCNARKLRPECETMLQTSTSTC